ncbi:hypothetical protein ACQ4PT_033873 [Festuca glaucescens]
MVAGEEEKGRLVLLDFWVSPFAQRCRIALAEKGLAYESVEQELLGDKGELLLRSNPVHKKVPVLLHDGHAVCESLVILEHRGRLPPRGAAAPPRRPLGARAGAAFFGGEAFGFVDVALIPLTSWFYSYEEHGGFSVQQEFPRLAEWARRCGERESVAKILTKREEVLDFIGVLKKCYGVE